MTEEVKPLAAIDVDGVISLFGFEGSLAQAPGKIHLINGTAHCIDPSAGERIARLAEVFELIWATGWEERANESLPLILGLPADLPYLSFDGRARFGTAHWKVEAIDEYAGPRPVAWVDDCLDYTCYEWAAKRQGPTMLVPTEADVGLTDVHVEAMLAWASSGYTDDR